MDDRQCLHRFVQDGSQEAFSMLVSRHVDLVYSAALRQVKDTHLAEDVVQSTFVALARKAKSLRPGASLAAWLLVATRYLALDALEARATRERHEREAAAMGKTEIPPVDPGQWEAISPHLDAALASLNGKDREAITLRYFQDKSFREVAEAMGLTVEAARQRVHRATVRMRAFFAVRGAPVSLEVIGPMIVARAVHAAPAGLATSATAAATAAPEAFAGGAVTWKGTVILMALTKAKVLAGTATLLLVSAGAVIAYKATSPVPMEIVAIRPATPVESAPSADWRARLNQVYGLADGQDVKQIAMPFVPERQAYWERRGNGQPLPRDATLTFEWDGSKLQWQTFNGGPGLLFDFLSLGAHLRTWQLDSSVPAGMKLPGDWVTRKGATTESLMKGLGPIVSAKLGRAVRFELRRVVREAVVARGTYRFVPLPGHKDDGVIEMVGNRPSTFMEPVRRMSLRQFLEGLDSYAYRKVFVEVDAPSQEVKVRAGPWSGDGSVLLRNFAAQTSLRFDREPREMDVWFMTEASPPNAQAEQKNATIRKLADAYRNGRIDYLDGITIDLGEPLQGHWALSGKLTPS